MFDLLKDVASNKGISIMKRPLADPEKTFLHDRATLKYILESVALESIKQFGATLMTCSKG